MWQRINFIAVYAIWFICLLRVQEIEGTEWRTMTFDFEDKNISYVHCKQSEWRCMNYTEIPAPRTGHAAIIYKTFNKTMCSFYNHECEKLKREQEKKECRKKCEFDTPEKV